MRDVNHPSVLLWDNGNEGGFNYDLVDDYPLYDPQRRTVIHPWQNEVGKINTTHYRGVRLLRRQATSTARTCSCRPRCCTACTTAATAPGSRDMWSRMLPATRSPSGAFLWVFADEGIVRTDRNGALDTDGNHGPDGIVGPYREKEGSFFTIKEVWSPVFVELGRLDRLPPTFDGRLRVENRYDFTDLVAGRVRVAPGALRGPAEPDRGLSQVRPPLPPRSRAAGTRCRGSRIPASPPATAAPLDLGLPATGATRTPST